MKRYFYTFVSVLTLALSSVANATIIWTNCPGDGGGAGICPDEYDVNTCGFTSTEDPVNQCSCEHHGYTWDGDSCEE